MVLIVEVVKISNGINIGISNRVSNILFCCKLIVNLIVIVLIRDNKGVFSSSVSISVVYICMVKFRKSVNSGDKINSGIKFIS